MRRHVVSVTTAADGSATEYSHRLTGKINGISYVKPGAGSFSDGVGFTITSEATGETIWTEAAVNATKHAKPRAPAHTAAGVAATLDGTRPLLEPVALAADRVKIVIAGGGNAKTGAFHILVD